MENLKKITYIAVFAVSIMAMIYMGNANSREFSWECEKAKEMASPTNPFPMTPTLNFFIKIYFFNRVLISELEKR